MHPTATRPLFGVRSSTSARQTLTALCLAAVCGGSAFAQSTTAKAAATPAAVPSDAKAQLAQNYGKLPLSFEPNQGQTDPRVKFLSRGNGYSLDLTDSAAVLALSKAGPRTVGAMPLAGPNSNQKTDVIRMELAGSAAGVRVDGADKLPGIANYFPASNPKSWHTNIPTYAKVKYAGVYPGVDLVYYGNQRQLEYDFVVAPNTSPKPIELHFAGAKKLKLTPEGDLAVIAKNGEIAFHKPIVYQIQSGQRQPVEASFRLEANNRIRFALGKYDQSRELVIDPVLVYSTYLGGTGTDDIYAIAIDSSGNAYVTGDTTSIATPGHFPTTAGSYQPSPDTTYPFSSSDTAFVTKLNAAGTGLLYSTFLGTGDNHGRAITVDSAGDAYVTGYTNCNLPTTPRVYQGSCPGADSTFVTELNPGGSALVASTYLGDGYFSQGLGIAVDGDGDVFVAGQANSGPYATFPTTTGAYQTANKAPSSVFITRFSANLSTLAYSTLIGGSNGAGDAATALVIDANDNAYVAGYASSTNYPVSSNAFQTTNGTAKNTTSPAPGYNAIVSVVNPAGSELLYSTYLGGSGGYDSAHSLTYYDYGKAIRRDSAGNIYVAGFTGSANFPATAGAFQTANPEVKAGGFQAGFVTKFNPTLSARIYSTYLGGTDGNADQINGLALDSLDNAYVTGWTSSDQFPVTAGAYQSKNPGAENLAKTAFLTKLNPAGSEPLFSTYFGGANGDVANGIAVDASGDAYLTGYTYSTNFPTSTTSTPFQKTNNSLSYTGWVAKLMPGTLLLTTTGLTVEPATQDLGSPVTFTATVNGSPAIPTGTVTFTIDGTVADTLTLSNGAASYTTASLGVGTHSVYATYNGSTTFYGSTSPTETVTIVPPLTAVPTFTPAAGTYTSVQSVTLADTTAGATIYYTLDGSTPTTGSAKYTTPITITSSTDVNAIAVATGHSQSGVASATYAIVGSPMALASPATAIATPSATLNAIVDTMGISGSYYFRYGVSGTPLATLSATTTLNATAAPIKVSTAVTGLKTKTTYSYQVIVTTAGGVGEGAVLTFTTN